MKLAAALAALLLTACSALEPQFDLGSIDQMIDYPIRSDQYAIVVLEEGGITPSQARKMALQRAAELTVESGNRYYTIESDETIQLTKTIKSWSDDDEEDGDQSQDPEQSSPNRSAPSTTEITVPALRLIIQCYPEKPGKKSYDACQFTKCS